MLDLENLTQQERISFLERFIKEINNTLDEITNGRDIPRDIRAMKLRIKVLENEDAAKYSDRIGKLKEELQNLENFWTENEPVIQNLQDERALYRTVLNDI